jgi:hypothetical protein
MSNADIATVLRSTPHHTVISWRGRIGVESLSSRVVTTGENALSGDGPPVGGHIYLTLSAQL